MRSRFLAGVIGFALGMGVYAYTVHDSIFRLPGDGFANMLIRLSDHGKETVNIGDPDFTYQRVCFLIGGIGPEFAAKRFFPNLPVLYSESDNSNLWHVAMHAQDQVGIIVLEVSKIAWQYEKIKESDLVDPNARSVCPRKVKILRQDTPRGVRYHLRPIYPVKS